MHIFLLHGDNTSQSHTRLMKYMESAKKRGWDTITYSDKSQNLPQLLLSDSLFGNEKLVIVEGFDLLTKRDLNWLTKEGKEHKGNVVIYHDGVLAKTKIKTIPDLEKIEEFTYPVLLWKMVDGFYPGNAKQFLALMHQVLSNNVPELVFGLLAKQVKDLYWVLVDYESVPYPAWRKSKLENTGKKFSKEKLERIISEMAEIDVQSKTSDSELRDLLDLLAVRELQ